ncbi:MAG TPA: SDR family oxidoreductase [Patescibacteria group bacterium]|nr:SDR family oxidoreductase [Patescibacteria group bacterium]
MNDRPIWITGAGGLLGNYFVQTAPEFGVADRIVGLTRPQLELTDYAAVRQKFAQTQPALVIHCAGLTRSPDCQAMPQRARQLNVEVTTVLSELAAEIDFVFFSTDLVFDGKKGHYDETEPINPLSVYAETKAAAENAVLRNPRHTVVRTSLNGGRSPTGDRAFNEQTRIAWEAGKTLTLFTDEFRCPIAAVETARTVWRLVTGSHAGLYHLAGSERLSRWQMGQLLAARWPQLNPKFVPGSAAAFPGVPRSPDTSLNCVKLERLLSLRLPGLTEWLAAHPEEIF